MGDIELVTESETLKARSVTGMDEGAETAE
jgi:hypothetical protein